MCKGLKLKSTVMFSCLTLSPLISLITIIDINTIKNYFNVHVHKRYHKIFKFSHCSALLVVLLINFILYSYVLVRNPFPVYFSDDSKEQLPVLRKDNRHK